MFLSLRTSLLTRLLFRCIHLHWNALLRSHVSSKEDGAEDLRLHLLRRVLDGLRGERRLRLHNHDHGLRLLVNHLHCLRILMNNTLHLLAFVGGIVLRRIAHALHQLAVLVDEDRLLLRLHHGKPRLTTWCGLLEHGRLRRDYVVGSSWSLSHLLSRNQESASRLVGFHASGELLHLGRLLEDGWLLEFELTHAGRWRDSHELLWSAYINVVWYTLNLLWHVWVLICLWEEDVLSKLLLGLLLLWCENTLARL